ncbi:MAG: hypothetical protein MJ113_08205 [Lachnospiraceae bacterium]|nr:hypothetical protein [Lachnospiraceae bacterium]
MKSIKRNAYAKINLSLDVLGKRTDGYHEVEMIMNEVSLYDVVTLEIYNRTELFEADEICGAKENNSNDLNAGLNEFTVGKHHYKLGVNKSGIPLDERNLVIKAAERFFESFHVEDAFFEENIISIYINKRIPMEAGLAGGSTDAAAVLHLLNEIFNAGFSLEELQEIGLKVGSDVPYCIMGGLALAKGRGEKLEKLAVCSKEYSLKGSKGLTLNVVLVKTKQGASTKLIYDEIDNSLDLKHPDTKRLVELLKCMEANAKTDFKGGCYNENKSEYCNEKEIGGNNKSECKIDNSEYSDAKKECEADNILKEFCENLSNIFYPVTSSFIPKLCDIQAVMAESKGCLASLMTGTGPTMFSLFEKEEEAFACAEKVRTKFRECEVFCCKTL